MRGAIMAMQPQVTISPDIFVGRLLQDIDQHFAVLRSTLSSLEDKSFVTRSEYYSSESLFHIHLGTLMPDEEIKTTLFKRTFCAMIASLVDFMDNLIAVSQLVENGILLTRNLSTEQDVINFLEDKLREQIQTVSPDKKLNKVEKLKSFPGISAFTKEAITGYFALRNSIEHHKSIADREIHFVTKSVKLIVEGTEITQLPYRVEKGEKIYGKMSNEMRVIEKGQAIAFTEQELTNLVLTLKHLIAKELQTTIAKNSVS
jgi:hypothetical protein